MLASHNELKISPVEYLNEYKKTFESLVCQKNIDRSDKINKLMIELKDQQVFKFIGSNKFKEKVIGNIRSLLSLKPGRVLIKELIKLNKIIQKPIVIKKGKTAFQHLHRDVNIEINLHKKSDDRKYNALFNREEVSTLKPTMVTLAHELIHEMHDRESKLLKAARDPIASPLKPEAIAKIQTDFDVFSELELKGYNIIGYEESRLVFKGLDTLEEQITILGVNLPRFLEKSKKLSKVDVLSENSFLFALNLLPRIDHQKGEYQHLRVKNDEKNRSLNEYYQWLSQLLIGRNDKIEKCFADM